MISITKNVSLRNDWLRHTVQTPLNGWLVSIRKIWSIKWLNRNINTLLNNYLLVTYPQSGSSSTFNFGSNSRFWLREERGKTRENRDKPLRVKARSKNKLVPALSRNFLPHPNILPCKTHTTRHTARTY